MEKTLLLVVFLLAFSSFAFAASLLPQDRIIDWSNNGRPKNLIQPKTIFDIKKDFNAIGDGVVDDSAALIKAIKAADKGGLIYIPEGTYLMKAPMFIQKDNIWISGAGANKTKIIFDLNDTSDSCITISRNVESNFAKVTSGFEKNSNKITVENVGNIVKGGFVEILQDNDSSVMYTKPLWEQVWAKNVVGQFLKVVDVSGNIITTEESLNITYKKELNVRIRPVDLIQNCGVEKLYIKRLDAGDGNMISFFNAAYGYINGIESDTIMRTHVSVEASYKCEIRDSYFHDAHDYGGGGHGYGVELKLRSSGCLVENNRFSHLRHSMMVHTGANGNVFGYNYSKDPFANGDHDPKTTICDISVHGHYPYMNLFESNTVQKIEISDWWGPCGGNTFFRNRIEKEGVKINDKSNNQNLLGNIIVEGDYGIETSDGVDATTIINHENRDYGEMSWDKRIKSDTLPESLYLKLKPDFLKNSVWPVIGPDCKGRTLIPAEIRMNNKERE
ncbi:MAG: glycosyl hydrolase family 28-related protein [bacterium]